MNTNDLFDRIAGELAGFGVEEDPSAPTRTLTARGTAFARLAVGGAEVFLPAGSPARGEALERVTTAKAGRGWVAVPDSDVAVWPTMFEQALHGVLDG